MILNLMGLLLFLTCIFMILLVLVQRGKGGGLTGALGGMGGQSAFGSKAGDTFTKITVGAAIFWIMLCMLTIAWFNPPTRPRPEEPPPSIGASPADASGAKSTTPEETGGMDLGGDDGDAPFDANLPDLTPEDPDASNKAESDSSDATKGNDAPDNDAPKADPDKTGDPADGGKGGAAPDDGGS